MMCLQAIMDPDLDTLAGIWRSAATAGIESSERLGRTHACFGMPGEGDGL
jgi:hypothetical protein